VDRLRALPDGRWKSALGASDSALGTPRSAFNWLGCRLQRFAIRPRTMRIGAERVKGYDLAEFSRAFARWLQS